MVFTTSGPHLNSWFESAPVNPLGAAQPRSQIVSLPSAGCCLTAHSSYQPLAKIAARLLQAQQLKGDVWPHLLVDAQVNPQHR